jgi:tetrahydromethanopterin S-methyltransferase subunit B
MQKTVESLVPEISEVDDDVSALEGSFDPSDNRQNEFPGRCSESGPENVSTPNVNGALELATVALAAGATALQV